MQPSCRGPLAAVCLTALLSSACAAWADDGVVLKHRFQKGRENAFRGELRMTMAGTQQGQAMQMAVSSTVERTELVLSVDGNGVAQIAALLTYRPASAGPKAPGPRASQTRFMLLKRTPTGKQTVTLPTKSLGILGGEGQQALNLPEFPARALKAGDQWQGKLSAASPLPLPFQPIDVTCVLEGFEEIEGERCARIRIGLDDKTLKPEAPGAGEVRFHVSMTFKKGSCMRVWFSPEAGAIRKLETKLLTQLEGQGGLGRMTEMTTDIAMRLEKSRTLPPAQMETAEQGIAALTKAMHALQDQQWAQATDPLKALVKAQPQSSWGRAAESLLKQQERFAHIRQAVPQPNRPAAPMAKSLEPSKVTLDMKFAKVTDILQEVEKQTGNTVRALPDVNDVAIAEFKVDGEGFWSTLDRLCLLSENVYAERRRATDALAVKAGKWPLFPTAYSGPFKAWIRNVGVKQNYETNVRDCWFEFSIMPEPKIGRFEYGNARLVSAQDSTGKTYHPPRHHHSASWHQPHRPHATLDGEWSGVKLSGMPAEAEHIAQLTFEMPVRLITEVKECRFANVLAAEKPATQAVGDDSFTVTSADMRNGMFMTTLIIRGKRLAGWGTNKFRIERDGKTLAQLQHVRSTHDGKQLEIELRYKPRGRDSLKDGFDLVVTYPAETVEARLEFTFEDLGLP